LGRPYPNDMRQRGWMGGRGAEKSRLKKRKALEEDAAKCCKLTDLFSRGQTQVATGKERHRPNDLQRNYSANVVALVNIVVALSTYSPAKYLIELKYYCAICVQILSQYNLLTDAYHVIGLAYKFLLTLSITQVACERSFSTLTFVKNRLR